MHAAVPDLNRLMKKAGARLNLKPHVVGFNKNNQVKLHAAGDLEVSILNIYSHL